MRVILSLLIFFVCLSANEEVSLQLKWRNSFQFAGFYMAKEKGFYKDVGLNVKIIELKSGNPIKKVIDKKATYGISDTALFNYKIKGYPIIMVMPIFKSSPISLLTTNSKIHSLKDLKKEKLSILKVTFRNLSLYSMLNSLGLKEKNFNIINKVPTLCDLENSNYIYGVYSTSQPYFLDKKGIKYKLFSPKDYGFNFYGDILFTTENEVNNHPDRVKKFANASKKGWRYALSHIDETIQVILNKYNSQHLTYDMLKYEATHTKQFISQTFRFNIRKVCEIKRLYKVLEKSYENFDCKNFIFNPYVITKKEREFVAKHKLKVNTTASWEPFNLIKDHKLDGIAVDYWNLISKRAQLKSSYVIENQFKDILDNIKNRKTDLTISTTATSEREKYALFSKPYATFPIVVVTKNDKGFISTLSYLSDKTVALPKGYSVTEIMRSKYPNWHYIYTNNIKESLKLVESGKVYATLGILPTIAYKINKYEFRNLKIAGDSGLNFPVSIMVRKDYKELIPIINRVIDNITEEEKRAIYEKWVSLKMINGYNPNRIDKIFITGVIVLTLLIIFIFVLLREIQKRKKLEKKLEFLATYDGLTKIFNRRKLDMTLDKQVKIARRYKRKLSLIFFDIDHFKKINDNYGHETGDQVLKKLSNLVKSNLRDSDIFGRWGGEEFLIILPETDAKNAYKVAEVLREKIQKFHFVDDYEITCSFGVAELEEKDNISSIVKKVDKLLYQSKENGRNRVTLQM